MVCQRPVWLGILVLLVIALVSANENLAEDVRVRLSAGPQLQLDVSLKSNEIAYEFGPLLLIQQVANEPSTTFRTPGVRPSQVETWATVTLLPEDRIVGMFYVDRGLRSFMVDTIATFSERSLIDETNLPSSCGTITHSEIGVGATERRAHMHQEETRPPSDPNGKDVAHERAKHGHHGRKLAVDRWFADPTCFDHDNVTRKFSIGVVVDLGMEARASSLGYPSTEKYVEMMSAAASAVYMAQMNIELVVQQVFTNAKAVTTADLALTGAKHVNSLCKTTYDPMTGEALETDCCNDGLALGDRLNMLQQWTTTLPLKSSSVSQPVRQGHWHLLTDCHPSPGFVGQSFIGTLCHQSYGAGVSSWGPANVPSLAHWRIFTHEIGHGFNSSHSFEYGIGTTGGIMDYGDGLYEGEYQIHPFKKAEVCSEINTQVNSCSFFETQTTQCGDGLLEKTKGEQCECPGVNITSCSDCVNCRFVGTSQCIRDTVCCSSDGHFVPSNRSCIDQSNNNLPGVCVMGTCQSNVCTSSMVVCPGSDPCRVQCAPISQPNLCSSSYFNLPDSTPCPLTSSSWGQCISGSCIPPIGSSNTGCTDLISPWWDADSSTYTCSWYAARPTMCAQYGFKLRNFGYTPGEACCGCGGGLQPGQDSGAPTKAKTLSPVPGKPSSKATQGPTTSPVTGCASANQVQACSTFKSKAACSKSSSSCSWCLKKRKPKQKKAVGKCVPGPCNLAHSCQLV